MGSIRLASKMKFFIFIHIEYIPSITDALFETVSKQYRLTWSVHDNQDDYTLVIL